MSRETDPVGIRVSGDDLRRLVRIEAMLEELIDQTGGAEMPDEEGVRQAVRERRGPANGRGNGRGN